MIISDKYGFAFIHIPKSGGSTVRHALMHLDERKAVYYERERDQHPKLGATDFAHLPLQALRDHFAADFALLHRYRSFALIRDPMRRFASSLHEYLHWKEGKVLADLPGHRVKELASEVVAKLKDHEDGTPIFNPALIHFSRQSDFVELDWQRIVSDLYPLERLDEMLSAIGQMAGEEISSRPINQRIQYRGEVLKSASEASQRAVRSVMPEAIWRPLFNISRNTMIKLRLVKLDSTKPFHQIFSPETEEFVRQFYRRDFEIYRELTRPGKEQD
jgi:hypothetical protein